MGLRPSWVLPQYNGESFVPGEKKRVRKIISASEFNFPVNGFVKGDIVYSNTREFEKYDQLRGLPYPEKDAILYFDKCQRAKKDQRL